MSFGALLSRPLNISNNKNKNQQKKGKPHRDHNQPRAAPANQARDAQGGDWVDLTCGAPLEMLPDRGVITWSENRLGAGAFGVVVRGEYYPRERVDPRRGVNLQYAGDGKYKTMTTKPIPCAVKVCRTHDSDGRPDTSIENERNVLGLRHRNVVTVFGIVNDGKRNVVALELAAFGSLHGLWSKAPTDHRFKEVVGLSVVGQVASGLSFLHSQGVAHLDIKAENVLVARFNTLQVKIADFGLSEKVKDKATGKAITLSRARGTPGYCAPEMLRDKGRGKFNEMADIWSLGSMALELFGGFPPYWAPEGRLPALHPAEGLPKRFWLLYDREYRHIGDDVRRLMEHMLCPDPRKRRGASGNVLVHRIAKLLDVRLGGKARMVCAWENRRHECSRCQKMSIESLAPVRRPLQKDGVPRPVRAPNGPPVAAASRTVTKEGTTKVHVGNGHMVVPDENRRAFPSAPTRRVGPSPPRAPGAAPPSPRAPPPARAAKTEPPKITVWSRVKRFFSSKRRS